MSMLPMRWEYRIYSVFMETGETWLAGLNKLGDEGWEVTDDITLFAHGGATTNPTLLLKRPKR
jgi:hypothetical protein